MAAENRVPMGDLFSLPEELFKHPSQLALLAYYVRNPEATKVEAAEALGITLRQIYRLENSLIAAEHLEVRTRGEDGEIVEERLFPTLV